MAGRQRWQCAKVNACTEARGECRCIFLIVQLTSFILIRTLLLRNHSSCLIALHCQLHWQRLHRTRQHRLGLRQASVLIGHG